MALAFLALMFLPSATPPEDLLPTNGVQGMRSAYPDLPMLFEENQGQTDPQVRFVSRGEGYTLFVTPTEATFVLAGPPEAQTPDSLALEPRGRGTSTVLNMRLLGANAGSALTGSGPTETAVNYFVGNDPAQWTRDVPTFSRLRKRDVYPGIDMVYRGTRGELEYDFIVSPGADPSDIRMRLDGPDRVRLDQGSLVAEFGDRKLVQHPPSIYQKIDGERQAVDGSFLITDDGEVRFDIGTYEADLPLVIDPIVSYSTYLGGSANDTPIGLAVDAEGNTYIAGTTASIDFPGADLASVDAGAGDDAFLAKISADGSSIVFATYMGGESLDAARAVTLGETGRIFVTGATDSPDFPVVGSLQAESNGFFDVFVSIFSSRGGDLLYSTYLGGEKDEVATAIALDGDENIFITGESNSVRFPTAAALQPLGLGTTDAFVTKLKEDGSGAAFSTYLGLDGGSGRGVVADGEGNVWVTGLTGSADFPTRSPTQSTLGGSFDAFVARFSPEGFLMFSTFLGGSDVDIGSGIALDSSGNVYVVGETDSADFPVSNAFQTTRFGTTDVFVTKFNSDGSVLLSSSFLGGSGTDAATSVATDSAGNVYVAGSTNSTDFPTAAAIQLAAGGGNDGFVSKFDSTVRTLTYSTYVGGSGQDVVGHMAVDATGSAYVTGSTDSTDFPTASPLQSTPAGERDAFLLKIGPNPTTFSVSDRGGFSVASPGTSSASTVGYSRIQPGDASTTPSGVAIFGFRADGILVSEAGVPASTTRLSGRIYAEVAGAINTGIAIVNPSSQDATISFYFTDTLGANFGDGSLTLGANQQIARFLDQAPFNGASVGGTFTFTSDVPVAVVALRGLTNERSEFLITTLPVAPLASASTDTLLFPHFADGNGWTTEVMLVNPTDAVLTGAVTFMGTGSGTSAANPVTLALDDGRSGSEFAYSIEPRTSVRLRSSNPASVQTGSIRVTPSSGSTTPAGLSVFSLSSGGVTVAEAGVPAGTSGTGFRVYAETAGTPGQVGSVRTGMAITNTAGSQTTVTFALTELDGTTIAMSASVDVPPLGQVAQFIDELFPALGTPFSGIVRVTSDNAVGIVGLRARTNERGDFLITTTPPSNETAASTNAETFFPHFADAGGWTTQFILFSGSAGQSTAGTLRFFNDDGLLLDLPVS